MLKEKESEGKIIDESEFTPADFDQAEREIDDTAIVAFEHPKRTRA